MAEAGVEKEVVDLVIRGGRIVDGLGGVPYVADIAISGRHISAVGPDLPPGSKEIDGSGFLVTPGFVDVHTHYDGQVMWDARTSPSSIHGVTTAVMGNCGVGFAPCRPGDREALVNLMSGVEDIPEAVMAEGLPWNWETFPEYLDAIAARARDIDVAAQLPHSALRVYVMGERGSAREPATARDLAEMKRLTEEAMRAGALGFATSRAFFQRAADGTMIFTADAGEAELLAIGAGMNAAGHGVIEALIDHENIEEDFALLRRVAQETGMPLSLPLTQFSTNPTGWKHLLDKIRDANEDGVTMRAQVIGRPTGMLLGLNLSFNPFSFHDAYRMIEHLPLADRVAVMRRPEVRARILADSQSRIPNPLFNNLHLNPEVYELGTPPVYEPSPDQSIMERSKRLGMRPDELAYDLLLEQDGHNVLFNLLANYADGTFETLLPMLTDANTICSLGDGGAHYGLVCDAGYPTFMLTHWTRERTGTRFPVEQVVKWLSRDTAAAVGLNDRGVIKPGYKADLNILDYDRLDLSPPRAVFDLPAGGRRLIQDTKGYVATIVSGEVTYRHGVPTNRLPGTLVRGPQRPLAPGLG